MTTNQADPTPPASMTTREIVEWMAARNPIYQMMRCEILIAEPGHVRLAMPITPEMSNTFGVMHGGMMFAFADLCFGFTGNGAQNVKGVSASAEIHWMAPGNVGEQLVGDATEVWRKGRNGLYDVKLMNGVDGDVIAIVHGRMRFIGGPVVVPDEPKAK
jgi:acyl-CoA thioesterase